MTTINRTTSSTKAPLSHYQQQPAAESLSNDAINLSANQQALWFIQQKEPGNTDYNITFCFRVKAQPDLFAMECALNKLMQRHPLLRASVKLIDKQPVFIVDPTLQAEIATQEAYYCDRHDIAAYVEKIANQPFDLSKGPLWKLQLIFTKKNEFIVFAVFHHIIYDGLSNYIFFDELASLYAAQKNNGTADLPPLDAQYADFSRWQRGMLKERNSADHLAYWKSELAGEIPVLNFADLAQRTADTEPGSAGIVDFTLGTELAFKLREFASRKGRTSFQILFATYALLLQRYSGQDDLIIGTAMLGRPKEKFMGVFGYFSNVLPLRIKFDNNPSVESYLDHVREKVRGAKSHQDYPLIELVKRFCDSRNESISPLVQTNISYQKTHGTGDIAQVLSSKLPQQFNWAGHGTEAADLPWQKAIYDLNVDIFDTIDNFYCMLRFNAKLFDTVFIENVAQHFINLLSAIVSDKYSRIADLPMMALSERNNLLDIARAPQPILPRNVFVHALFEKQALENPYAIAASFAQQQITYCDLDIRANQLANYLIDIGAGPVIGVAMERSLDMLVALLAILKAGAAYLPIDLDMPLDRVADIIDDSQINCLISHKQKQLSPRVAHLYIDGDWQDAIAADANLPVPIDLKPTDLAYVMYTSGSTGKPKGVMYTHAGMTNMLQWLQETYYLAPQDVVLQKTPYGFDVSVWEIFWPLLAGAKIAIAAPNGHRDIAYLHQLIEREKVTVINFVPSMLHLFIDAKMPNQVGSLRLLLCAGEALTQTLVNRAMLYLPQCTVHNLYGPTETQAVTAHHCVLNADATNVSLGKAIAGIELHVLDKYQTPVPVGVFGELYIGGIGLARGYLNREDLTQQRFIRNPFSSDPRTRLYRSGDRVRYTADGTLEYRGRLDDQVKIRGIRIEPGEIEAQLMQHDGVKQALVTVCGNTPSDKFLAAYVVIHNPPAAHLHSTQLRIVDTLRDYLRNKLPAAMVPASIVLLDAIPLTQNGKVDKRALPQPVVNAADKNDYVVPASATERRLAALWCELLAVEKVGIETNFFDIGGHSLLAIQLISLIREHCQVDLPTQAIFNHPTIKALAVEIDKCIPDNTVNLPIGIATRDAQQPLAWEERYFFSSQTHNRTVSVIQSVFRLTGKLHTAALISAIDTIVARHEIFRTNFFEQNEKLYRRINEPCGFNVVFENLAEINDQKSCLLRHIENDAEMFDQASSALFKASLLKLDGKNHLLILTAHHIIFDGWSTGVLIKEIIFFYKKHLLSDPSLIDEPRIQYADYAAWQQQQLNADYLVKLETFWLHNLANLPPPLALPLRQIRAEQKNIMRILPVSVPPDALAAIAAVGNAAGATLYMTMLAVLSLLMNRQTDAQDILIAGPVTSRSRIELDNLLGCFVNMLIFRNRINPEQSFKNLLEQVRRTSIDAYAHQDMPFARLVECLSPKNAAIEAQLVQIVLDMPPPDEVFALPDLSIRPEHIVRNLPLEAQMPGFDLIWLLSEGPQGLVGCLLYNSTLIEETLASELIGDFVSLIHLLAADSYAPLMDIAASGSS